MFISVVFNTEYLKISTRKQWYLKNLYHCKKNDWILITHEYMRDNWEQLQNEMTQSLFDSWEIQPFSAEDVKDVEQYYLPDSLFEQMEQQCGSRTEMLYQLASSANPQLENVLQQIITTIKQNHPSEPIDGMFYNFEPWQFIRDVCQKNRIVLIPYSFTCIRRHISGYRQTLFQANVDANLYTTQEAQRRYEMFLTEGENHFPVFSHRELIAFLGKERTLPLIPVMNAVPQYEMGICTECCSIIPQFFVLDKTTDDDVRYEVKKLYDREQITVRNHWLQVGFMRLDASTMHSDPTPWILSCKRLTAARSQIGLKFLLWNRTAVIKPDTMAYAFLCEKDYASQGHVDIKALNYYLFAYLIPGDLMFSKEYWEWRKTNPSEIEIYQRHLDFIIQKLNLPKSILTEQDEPKRFRSFLESRGCDKELINILLEDKHDFELDYNTASSRIVVNGKSYWRLNKLENGIRRFHIELDESADTIEFYPWDDAVGCAKLISVSVNGKQVDVTQHAEFKYMPKATGYYSLPLTTNENSISIDIEWDIQSNNEFLLAHA